MPLLSTTDQELLVEPITDTPSDNGSGITQGQRITPLLSATDQEPSLSHDAEVSTEAITEALHNGSDHVAMDTLDETKGDDNTTSSQQDEGKGELTEIENKDDEEEERCGGVGCSIILQSQSQAQLQDPDHDNNIDPPEELTTANSQPLTRKLLASGGDLRALLLSDQPLSSFLAQTDDTGKEGAEPKNDNKDEEEVELEERFVRPPRLRFALSKEAANDGFPSAIALSLRWHPDHMQDRPGDASNLSIRAAFDTKFDEYYVFRHWRPSQGR